MQGFREYQTRGPASNGAPGKALRSIPERILQYGLHDSVRNGRILDIGCNRGLFGALMGEADSYLGLEVDIIEYDNALRESRAAGSAERCSFINTDFESYQPGDRQFSVILMLAVHAYIKLSPVELARRLTSMMEPDGILMIESHVVGFLKEPEAFLYPLVKELSRTFTAVRRTPIAERGLPREVITLKKGIVPDAPEGPGVTEGKPLVSLLGDLEGMACQGNVHLLDNGAVRKQYIPITHALWGSPQRVGEHWNRELSTLRSLKGKGAFSQLLHADEKDHTLYMSFAGHRISLDTRPDDWADQVKEIKDTLSSMSISHNDVFSKNMCVRDGRITLIDWGQATASPNGFNDYEAALRDMQYHPGVHNLT